MKSLMDSLSKAEGFQWDSGNLSKSASKHQVSCEEGEQAFFNSPLLLLEDPSHSKNEVRLKAFGKSDAGRLITISFMMRGNLIRIISARPMHKKEKKTYEKQNEI